MTKRPKTSKGESLWQRNEARWDAMRRQSAQVLRADRISRNLPVDPPASLYELERYLKPLGDADLNHKMVVVGEFVLAEYLRRQPGPELYPEMVIAIYKAMLRKSIRVGRHGYVKKRALPDYSGRGRSIPDTYRPGLPLKAPRP